MAQQISAGMSFFGGRGFSSASAMGGLGGHRTYVASVGHPIGNEYGVRCFGSQSLSNLGGSGRISYGGYGGSGSGCYSAYGAYGYGHMGYGTMGFGGRMGHIGNGGLGGGYSNFRGDGIRGVTINEKLLKPLHVGVDPQEQEARNHEREEMKTLNDQFACFIDKVRYLEQQNKVLDTKWRLLQECALPARKNLEPYYENFISNMKKQLDCLLSERDHLTSEEASIQQLVEEFKTGNKILELLLECNREDVDCIFLSKAELEGKVDLLSRELEFRRCVHAEELAQLDCHVCDTNILLQMDNSRNIDADLIIKNVEAWYQSIAQKSKEEANALYESRFLELQQQKGKYSNDLKINQHAIADLTRLFNKLQSEHDLVKKQVDCLQSSICDVEQRGDVALKDARDKQTELQTALQKAKDDLARLLKDYHELLNTKLALDIEIATYKTMLEGEESRIYAGNFVSIDVVKPPYTEDVIGYPAYGPIGGGYGGVCGLGYGADFCRRGFGRCRRRGSYCCGGVYGGDYSGGYSGGRNDGGYGRRRSWSGGCGTGYGGAMAGGYCRGYGGSSGGGYSGGGGYGGSSGGGYGGSSGGGNSGGGGYGGSSGRGYGGSSGGGNSGGGGNGGSSGRGYGGSSGGGNSGGGGYGGCSGRGYGGSSGGGNSGGGGYGGSSGRGYGGSSGGGNSGGGGYGGSSGRGYGGSSGGGNSGGGGYGGSCGGGYSGGGGYGGDYSGGRGEGNDGESGRRRRRMSGRGSHGGDSGGSGQENGGGLGGGSGGQYSGGRRNWSSRSGEYCPRSSTSGGQGSGGAEYSGRGYSSRSAQGSASNMGQQGVSGGWTSGGIPYGGGGFVPKIVGGPVIVGGCPGIGGGLNVGCVPTVGIPAVGFPPVGVPSVSVRGVGIGSEPCVEVISPLGVCYPGAVASPLGVCYPGVGGPVMNA
ncbi:PREDICTED: keratin, type II cytoskeletal 1-like [Gekko japonicus]|uniref:Keratin, type II cytoskeletal 1-like n=1 Tax=Gekko japonicus TaxID=146911 RepID=A0ABM1LEY6_GEKJA|nr:PREDICTED: keratin, type II cytoskeletal 1-like [Gekko japonicus]